MNAEVEKILKEAQESRMFGSIELVLQAGDIVLIKKVQSFKLNGSNPDHEHRSQ